MQLSCIIPQYELSGLLQQSVHQRPQHRGASYLLDGLSCVGSQSPLPFPVICDIWMIHMQLKEDGQRILPALKQVLCKCLLEPPQVSGLLCGQGAQNEFCNLWAVSSPGSSSANRRMQILVQTRLVMPRRDHYKSPKNDRSELGLTLCNCKTCITILRCQEGPSGQ